ncbi:MAG: hypothetical protein ACRCX2_27385 [Paraclostridium sp.]
MKSLKARVLELLTKKIEIDKFTLINLYKNTISGKCKVITKDKLSWLRMYIRYNSIDVIERDKYYYVCFITGEFCFLYK